MIGWLAPVRATSSVLLYERAFAMLVPRSPWMACAAVLLAAGLAAAAPVPGEEQPLRYKFKEGQKTRYTLEEKSNMEMDLGAGAIKIDATTRLDLTWTVTKVGKDGKATVTQTIDRVRFNLDTPQGKANYDSKDAKAPEGEVAKQLADALAVFLGAETTLTVDPQAGIESLKFSDKLCTDISNLPAGVAPASQALSEDAIRRMVAQCVPALPKAAPAKGKTWDSKLQATFQGQAKMTLDNKHSYEGAVTRGGQTLEKITTKPTLTVETEPGSPGTLKVEKQDINSTSYFDRSAGRLVETAFAQKVTLTVTQGEKTATMKGVMNTTLKLADKDK
jgi:hypothetical protein